jgi:hypothetical protein
VEEGTAAQFIPPAIHPSYVKTPRRNKQSSHRVNEMYMINRTCARFTCPLAHVSCQIDSHLHGSRSHDLGRGMHAGMFVLAHANGARLHMHACKHACTLTLAHMQTHAQRERERERKRKGDARARSHTWECASARVTSPRRTERKRNLQFINDKVDPTAPCWEVFEQSLELSGVIIVDGPLDIVDDLRTPCCF